MLEEFKRRPDRCSRTNSTMWGTYDDSFRYAPGKNFQLAVQSSPATPKLIGHK
jgi:hypothetical protein